MPANNLMPVGRSGMSGLGQPDIRMICPLTSFSEHFVPSMDPRIWHQFGRQGEILWTSDLEHHFRQPDVRLGRLLTSFCKHFFSIHARQNLTSVWTSGGYPTDVRFWISQPDVRMGSLLTSFCEQFFPSVRIWHLFGRQGEILWTSDFGMVILMSEWDVY